MTDEWSPSEKLEARIEELEARIEKLEAAKAEAERLALECGKRLAAANGSTEYWHRVADERAAEIARIRGLAPNKAEQVNGFGPLEVVRLLVDLPAHKLTAGAIGTVVEVFAHGKALEVEFADDEGKTLAVATLRPSEVEHTGKVDP